MLACWAGGSVAHDGEFYSFRPVSFEPRAAQLPHPPLWVGGHSSAALRRAARFADVWHPHDLAPAEVTRYGEQLDALAGRQVPRTVRIQATTAQVDQLGDVLAGYAGAGCAEVVLDFRSLVADEVAAAAEAAAARLFA
jgi:alkanesulfonate monooxygenase SsuD/methylene tetrahydromethanopterin reductase-like flavin-dependent oxidoreductase (luciferase family)